MAFTGVPRVVSLGKHLVRITGIHLDGNQSGSIGLSGDAGADIQLPATFPDRVDPGAASLGLDMTDLCECSIHDFSIGGGATSHLHQVQTLNPFRILLVNDVGVAGSDL